MKETAVAAEKKKETADLHIKMDVEQYETVKELARYAVVEGLIPDEHRGNVTGFINWCLSVGQEALRQYAIKKRGF